MTLFLPSSYFQAIRIACHRFIRGINPVPCDVTELVNIGRVDIANF